MDKFLTVKDAEGRRVATLSPTDLGALQARCAAYDANCAAQGQAPEAQFVLLCAAVEHYATTARGPIVAAMARFSALRQDCIQSGYVPPPLHGTPHASTVEAINGLLREALAALRPLPGEDPALTARLVAEACAAVASAITEASGPALAKTPPRYGMRRLDADIAHAGAVAGGVTDDSGGYDADIH